MTETLPGAEASEATGTLAPVADAPATVAETPAPAEQPAPAAPAAEDTEETKRRNREFAERRLAEKERKRREAEAEAARYRESTAKPPRVEDFADPDEFERARLRHAAREVLADDYAARADAARAAAEQEIEATWAERLKAATAEAPTLPGAIERVGSAIPLGHPVATAIKAMEDGPGVVLALDRDPSLLATLLRLPPALAAVELGRIAASVTAPARRVVSSAPPPVAPVVGAGGPVNKSPTEMTMAEYRAWRMGK